MQMRTRGEQPVQVEAEIRECSRGKEDQRLPASPRVLREKTWTDFLTASEGLRPPQL